MEELATLMNDVGILVFFVMGVLALVMFALAIYFHFFVGRRSADGPDSGESGPSGPGSSSPP